MFSLLGWVPKISEKNIRIDEIQEINFEAIPYTSQLGYDQTKWAKMVKTRKDVQ